MCKVVLTFGTGFTYSADATFVHHPAAAAPCYECFGGIYATQQTFVVNNPSGTCVDAGADVDVPDAPLDGPTDAPSDGAIDVAGDD